MGRHQPTSSGQYQAGYMQYTGIGQAASKSINWSPGHDKNSFFLFDMVKRKKPNESRLTFTCFLISFTFTCFDFFLVDYVHYLLAWMRAM